MKQFRILWVLLAIVLATIPVFSGIPAYASQQANVVQTATGAYMNITVTPTTYDYGTVDAGVDASTIQSQFSVNSTSSVTIHVLVSVATWTSGGVAWTYGAAAFNTGRLLVSADTALYDTTITAIATSYNLTDNLAAGTGKGWESRLDTPSDFADGQQNSINITLQAYRA